jgi:hypothetical protein
MPYGLTINQEQQQPIRKKEHPTWNLDTFAINAKANADSVDE